MNEATLPLIAADEDHQGYLMAIPDFVNCLNTPVYGRTGCAAAHLL
jgi:hypothetical protein